MAPMCAREGYYGPWVVPKKNKVAGCLAALANMQCFTVYSDSSYFGGFWKEVHAKTKTPPT